MLSHPGKHFHRDPLGITCAVPIALWYAWLMRDQIGWLLKLADSGFLYLTPKIVIHAFAQISSLTFAVMCSLAIASRDIAISGPVGFRGRLVSLLGTYFTGLFLLLPIRSVSDQGWVVASFLILGGTSLAIWALVHLWSSMSLSPQARRFVTTGPYAFIRHPMYFGELIAIGGASTMYAQPWSALLLVLHSTIQVARIVYEERVLRQTFYGYVTYARKIYIIPYLY